MRSIRSLFVGVFALGLAGCGNRSEPTPSAASAAASASMPAGERLAPIAGAELRRAAEEITTADLQSRDVGVRRAAARALARIGGEAAHPGLVRALGDEDDEVLAWAAYGLGFWCKGHEKDSVTALVARALSRPPAPAGAEPAATPMSLDADAAIRRAIGRCGAEESEPTLVAWLAEPRPRAVAAALALGDLAMSKQKLREETLAALLNLAAGSASTPPITEALFAVGRLDNVPLTVVDRIREVATARLLDPSEARLFAVRALGRAGDGAAGALARVLGSPGSSPPERAEAARQLKRLGKAGQRVLGDALPPLVPSADPVALTGLVGEDFGVLLTVIESLDGPSSAKKALTELASLPAPPKPPEPVARRVAWLRCTAARVLAGANYHDKALLGCEAGLEPPGSLPTEGELPMSSIAGRAVVAAIGGAEIVGPRLAAFRAYALHGDRRAREDAIELLEKHDEIDGAAAILVEALGAKESGIVATAADVLAKKPQRAGEPAPKKGKKARRKKDKDPSPAEEVDALAPAPAIVKALLDALARPAVDLDPELSDSLIDAAGALAIKETKGRLDGLCRSNYPTTREHAAKALGLLGDKKGCPAHAAATAPRELEALVAAKTTITFEADAGSLTITLDPALAPAIVTRAVELVKSGYYDGMVVHRVVPGYVTQFGAPFGDGYGGPEGKASIPCETSPLPFAPLTVGIALSGRDTGSSQLFVMHARYPHLDGNYAIVGTATGPWGAFVDGDLIRHAKVTP